MLVAKAFGRNFEEISSLPVTVVVDNTPPGIALTSLHRGQMVCGVVDVETEAGDVVGIQEVRVSANGRVVGVAHEPPYRIPWNTTVVPNTRYTVEARVFDRAGNNVASEPITVTVANPNRPPVLEPVGSQTVAENQPLSIRVQVRDPDSPRDPVSVTVLNLPSWATFDPSTGMIEGTPPFTEASLRRPARVYSDVRIDACDPEPLCDHEIITISVIDVNQAPNLRVPETLVIREGETASVNLVGSDPDGDLLTWDSDLLPSWAAFDMSKKMFAGAPGFDIASLAKPEVSRSFSFEVCDPQPLCTSQSITVTIVNVNRAPEWEAVVEQEINEHQLLRYEVEAYDPDGDSAALKTGALGCLWG